MKAGLRRVGAGMSRKREAVRPWVHLDPAPLFDQTNGTAGATAREQVDDPGTSDSVKLLEKGIVSSIITFGAGIS